MNQLTLLKSIVSDISGLLESEEFLNAHRFPNRFVRKRKLSMHQIILFLLHSTKQAMHQNISRIMDLENVAFPDVSKQAVSRARQGINPSLFKELFDLSVDSFNRARLPAKLWHGKERVYAVDGSKIQLPDSKSNFNLYGEMFSKANPGRKWSMALASVIYDVNKSLESLGFLKGAVLIFDRGYYSEAMFRYFSENGYLCVMRLREGLRLARSCKGDSLFSLDSDNGSSGSPLKIPVRVISVNLGNGTTEYLATNIFDKKYTQNDFKELYFKRWSLELKYNEIKNQLLLEEFNGATSTSVEQEFFINLLYSNLASLAKSSADSEIAENSRSDNRFRYQANRAYIIGRLKDILTPILARERPDSDFDSLFRMAARNRSQVQPGRSSKRGRVKRDRVHFNNRKRSV